MTDYLNIDLTNPGHFFACCGLLEMAYALNGDAEGWFEDGIFKIRAGEVDVEHILSVLQKMEITSLGDKIDAPISLTLDSPFLNYRLDWWEEDTPSNCKTLKTWAGRQKVVNIAKDMQESSKLFECPTQEILKKQVHGVNNGIGFYFDSKIGDLGGALDVGFSFNKIKSGRVEIKKSCLIKVKPFLELLALIGIQRFRPLDLGSGKFVYVIWLKPNRPILASMSTCGAIQLQGSKSYVFSLHYVTEYLKRFCSSKRLGEIYE